MDKKLLATAVGFMSTEGKVSSLTAQDRAAVFQWLQKGRGDSPYLDSLRGQLFFQGTLSDKQWLVAANIMKGAFHKYLKANNFVVAMTLEGEPQLVPTDGVGAAQA